MITPSKVTPLLWFDNNLEEAMRFYASVFKNTKMPDKMLCEDGDFGQATKIQTATFEIEGQKFMGLNGGPYFKFNEAVSFFISCETQQEVDYFWERLSEGGSKSQCGWLKDKFGLSWQVVPAMLSQVLGGSDADGSKRAMQAMMQMTKLNIVALETAYSGQ